MDEPKIEPSITEDTICVVALGLFAGLGAIAVLYILAQCAFMVYG